jgi:type II secretory pathway pseudopilin PulG
MTLVELMVAMTIAAVLATTAWLAWEISCRETAAATAASAAQRNAFSTLRRIEQEVMRAETIQVPDPEYAAPSMQLNIPSGGGTVRRAFRLEGGALIVDLKDEMAAPYEAFSGLTALSFVVLDPPTSSQVRITCSAASNRQSVQMQTVATRRN